MMAPRGFYFKADHRRAVGNIIKMKKAFLTGNELETKSKQLLEQVKQAVITKLKDDKFSKRDPQATNKGFGLHINRIVGAINTSVLRRNLSLVGGVGEITKLDEADPLLRLKNPPRVLTPEVRLWRILEYGTIKKGYPIQAKGTSKKPDQMAKIKGAKRSYTSKKERKGKSGPTSKKVPQLRFFWKRKNVYFRGPVVIHPGQEGRGVWMAVLNYEVREIYGKGMKAEMKRIVQQYSGR
jgi:hypothetical protein